MKDILLGPDGDLDISNGDFVIGDSSEQNKKLLLLMSKGSLKQFPGVGVGIVDFLNNEDENALLTETISEFRKDGMTVESIQLIDQKLAIKANY